jgi:hypothetical protein
MSELPKLRVKKNAWEENFEVMDFEQAQKFPFNEEVIISVEGEQICSYECLLEFAADEKQKGKQYLEVMILPMILGG